MNRITSNVDFPSFFMRLGRAKGLSGGGGIPMPFEANVPDPSTGEMLGVAEGIGGLTESASTSIEMKDYQGVYNKVFVGSPAWEGGRVVSNYMSKPNDMQGSPWIATSGATVVSPTEIVLSDDPNSRVVANMGYLTAGDWRVSVEMRSNEIDTVLLEVGLDRTDVAEVSGITTEWQRFSVLINSDWNAGWYSGVLRNGQSGTLFCRNWLLEHVSGQSNQNPSTFQDYGTKTFARMNGNTVTDNIVNETMGALIDPLPRLIYAPEKTNLEPDARDLTGWSARDGLSVPVVGGVGIDGTSLATIFEDADAAQVCYARNAKVIVASSNYVVTTFYISKTVSTNYFRVYYQLRGGTAQTSKQFSVRYSDGDIQNLYNITEDEYEVADEGDFYRIAISSQNNGSNNELWVQIYPQHSIDGTNAVAALTGSAVVDGVERLEYASAPSLGSVIVDPPIFTAGAPVTRTARALSFDGANHDPDQSGYYFEWEPSMLVVGGTLHGVIGFTAGVPGDGFFHPQSASRLRLRQWYSPKDSENLDDGKAGGETHYSAFVIDTDVSDSLQTYDYDGAVWTTPLSSVGSIAVPGIYLGVKSPHVIKYGPIRRYQAPLEDMKAQLEADIAAGEAA